MEKEFQEWLKDRPQIIKDLAAKYPPYAKYRIRENAPYAISCSGTTVHLRSYFESREIGIVVLAKDKLPAAIEHELFLGRKHGMLESEIIESHAANIDVVIDPKWLELIVENKNQH